MSLAEHDFGTVREPCDDCWNGRCTMNCSERKIVTDEWLTEGEPNWYRTNYGADPYAIWVTRWQGGGLSRRPARLLAYADNEQTKAHVIYFDGGRDVVFRQQMHHRQPVDCVLANPSKNVPA